MKRVFFLCLFAFFVFVSVKAVVENRVINGFVRDSESKPVIGAVVSCVSLNDSAFLANAITDSIGSFRFSISTENTDSVWLYVSCVGYERQSQGIESGENIQITLHEVSHQLQGVTVTAKSTVKEMPGGFSFAPGGAEMLLPNGLELLKLTPMLDVRGGVSIFGKGDATVYINGRDPHMPVESVFEVLRTVEPKDIKRIEIIYNPGSSQRASDQSGIVNIVMKRPDYGWVGMASLGAVVEDDRVSETPAVYFGYGYGRFKFSVNARLGDARGVTKSENRYEYKNEKTDVTNMLWRKYKTISGGANANATYDITNKSQVGFSVSTSLLGGNTWRETSVSLVDNSVGVVRHGIQTAESKTPYTFPSYSFVGFYSLQTDDRGSGLDLNLAYSRFKQESTDNVNISSDLGMPNWLSAPYEERSRYGRHRFGAEAKFTKKYADGSCIGLGGAYDASHIDDATRFLDVVDDICVDNVKRSNRFEYDENVVGLYANYSRQWSKFFGSSVGLRAEQTHTRGNQHATDETFSRDYWQLFPNVSLNFNTSDSKHILGVDYNVFVWRPEYSRLNPFKYWTSQNTYKVGNPDLEPGKTHFLTFKYRLMQWYEFSVMGSFTPKYVSPYTVQGDDGVSKTAFGDLGRSRAARFNLNLYRSLFGGRWYLNANASAGYGRLEGKVDTYPLNEHNWGYGVDVNSTVFMNKGRDFFFQAVYSFSAVSHQGSETRPAKHLVILNLTKSFAFGGTVSLDFSGIFPWKDKTFYDTSTYYYQTRQLTSPATLSVTFRQRFGKKLVRGANERRDNAFEQRQR